MEHKEDVVFSYTYSAKERAEIRSLREKYKKKDTSENPLKRVRRLDRGVTSLSKAIALTVGIVGILLFGFGMSLVMSELSDLLSLSVETAMLWGILVGIVGSAVAGLAYPVYNWVYKYRRKKVAPEILRLTDELLK